MAHTETVVPWRLEDPSGYTKEHALLLSEQDPLKNLRNEFIIPTKADLLSENLSDLVTTGDSSRDTSIYLCGNSLGLQPKRARELISKYLTTWGSQGVHGHFKQIKDSPLVPWLDVDEDAAKKLAPVVGALPSEVAVMQTLTANLHILMCSFYKPTKERYKIIMESKAFPSDHFLVESQIRLHNLDPKDAMICISPEDTETTFTTPHILSLISLHASTTSLLLLPGIQFYTGQLFDIPTITAFAQSHGIIVGWDLAHAAGNIPLHLHDWNVDFAAWCHYKYMNSGPGAIGGCFVHERHEEVSPALKGWWGSRKEERFNMDNMFHPIAGAGAFQLSNPSALDITSVTASLDVFHLTDMAALRRKSLELTGYLEELLMRKGGEKGKKRRYQIITPKDPAQRGAQLSILLEGGLLEVVMVELERAGVVIDERKPDVVRAAPAPLYNNFSDVWDFVEVLEGALDVAQRAKEGRVVIEGETMLDKTT